MLAACSGPASMQTANSGFEASALSKSSANGPSSAMPVTNLTLGSRAVDWQEGDAFQRSSPYDGQIQQPTYSGSNAQCDDLNCSHGSGAITFHITRPNTTTPQNPNGSWRSMEILTSNVLTNGQTYDCVFSTTVTAPPDVYGSANIIWQDHANVGGVYTNFGLANNENEGTTWSLSAGGSRPPWDISTNPGRNFVWKGQYQPGETDMWEIQFKNAADSSGWLDLYRNGILQIHYTGGNIVPSTAYDVIGFGVYEFHWENATNSSALFQTVKFNSFALYRIPGRIAPLATSARL
jgi:hypothetical protein